MLHMRARRAFDCAQRQIRALRIYASAPSVMLLRADMRCGCRDRQRRAMHAAHTRVRAMLLRV